MYLEEERIEKVEETNAQRSNDFDGILFVLVELEVDLSWMPLLLAVLR